MVKRPTALRLDIIPSSSRCPDHQIGNNTKVFTHSVFSEEVNAL